VSADSAPSSGQAIVRSYADDRSTAWDAYVHRAAGATACHQMGWARAIECAFRHRPCHLYAERDGAVVGVLPLFLVRSRLFGSRLTSTPNAIYGGILADDAAARDVLLAEAKRLARTLQVDYLELRDPAECEAGPVDPELETKHRYVTFERSITADDDALMRSYPGGIRYTIRQGQKRGLRAEMGREELLDAFYGVFAANMRDLGTPVFPKAFFAELLRQFPQTCDMLLVRQGDRVAGGTLNLLFRGVVLPHFGCADRRLRGTGVSTFMYWQLMRRAAARGCTGFDFGRSNVGSGSWAFKRRWGMRERALPYKYLLVRAKAMPRLDPGNPRFRLLIGVWKRLPLGLTRVIGPTLVRGLV
jgi:FemAB-related protein (PEP-CTERM system-associated)